MKKTTFYVFFFLMLIMGGYAQVQVGEGNNQAQNVPFEPYYKYSYAQSVYLASEINASGTITELQWYYSGTSNFPSQFIDVYLGHSDRTSFANSSDFEPVANLTLVYSGSLAVTAGQPGWVTITLDSSFEYNGDDNLIVAVDENLDGYDDSNDDFHCWNTGSTRSIYAYTDYVNLLPTDPTNNFNETVNRGTSTYVPNIIFGGIAQLCPNPSGLAVSGITTEAASFEWISDATSWELVVLEQGEPAPSDDTEGITVTGTPEYTDNTLEPQTNYQVYVRSVCGADTSGWVGPVNFLTHCLSFDELSEDFDSVAYGATPDCWTPVKISNSDYAFVGVVDYNSGTDPNSFELYNSGDNTAVLMLVTPGLTQLQAGTHRMTFKATGSGYSLIVGTMSDPSDPDTFTEVESFTLTSGYQSYFVEFNSSSDDFVAFRHGVAGTYHTIHIDDILWEPIPTEAPLCAEVTLTPDAECGNYDNILTWSAVPGADGYYVSVGSAPAEYDIADNIDLGSTLTFTFAGEAGTTYYYVVTPYNSMGIAEDCEEDSFTTAPDPCYCLSVPTSFDNNGITNVQIGTANFVTPAESYYDHTGSPVDLAIGMNNDVKITFETGWSYDTYIFIDFDDNMTFGEDELVFTGESSYNSPTILDASFILPEDAIEGTHRMRIVTGDIIDTPDPCYSDTYGVTLDFTVNVMVAECEAPEAIAEISPDCDNNQFFVDIEIISMGSGVPYISDGTDTWEIEEAGLLQIGPFENGSSVNLFVAHGTEDICNLNLGNFRYVCPPSCDNAIEIPGCNETITAVLAAGEGSWNSEFCGWDTEGTELIYSFTPTVTGVYSLELIEGNFDYVDYAWKVADGTCEASGWTCLGDLAWPEIIEIGNLEEGVEYLILLDNESLYSVTHQFQIVCAPTCTNPTVAYFVAADCDEDEQFLVNVNITNLGTATSLTVSDDLGSTPVVVTETGVTQFGPYPNGTGVVITVVNDQDASCTLNSSQLIQISCPPSYDNLCGAMPIVVGAATPNNAFTLVSTTKEINEPQGDCFDSGVNGSAWFSFIAPPSGEVIISTDIAGSQLTDSEIALYSSEGVVCNDLSTLSAAIACDQDGGTVVNYNSVITRTGGNALTPGAMYYVQVDRWGSAVPGTFGLRITDANPLATDSFLNGGFSVYPNPVNHILNLNGKQNITKVELFNLLGQQVMSKTANAQDVQLDMSSIAAGTYLVKVTSENAVKTVKVIKN
jgi:hypothetical protein